MDIAVLLNQAIAVEQPATSVGTVVIDPMFIPDLIAGWVYEEFGAAPFTD